MSKFDEDDKAGITASMGAWMDLLGMPRGLQDALLKTVREYEPAERTLEVSALRGEQNDRYWRGVVESAFDDADNGHIVWLEDGGSRFAAIVPADQLSKPAEEAAAPDGFAFPQLKPEIDLIQVEKFLHAHILRLAEKAPGTVGSKVCENRSGHLSHRWTGEHHTYWCPGLITAGGPGL